MSFRGVARWFACLTALSVATLPAAATTVTFHLVPEGVAEPKADDFLPSGTVFLYQQGKDEAERSVPLNGPVVLGAGNWLWIAEAPGFVTVAAGMLVLDGRDGSDKTIVWPAAPACRVLLPQPREMPGVSRLDVVSLDRGAVYPHVHGALSPSHVPAGRILAYAVGNRGLVGISRPQSCRAGEVLALQAPEAPPRDQQDLMVSVRAPLDAPPADLEATAELHPPGPEPVVATARVETAGRVTFFFLGLPAVSGSIGFRHPDLRTATAGFDPTPGQADELGEVELRERADLLIPVDYRPRRSHHVAELLLYRCGDRRIDNPRLDHRDCAPEGDPVPLQEGLHTYRFPSLDHGQYLVDAMIDDERVPGAGNYLQPYLGATDAAFAPLDPALLWELEIHGEIRRHGESVAGEIRLDTQGQGSSRYRRFHTGNDDQYRLFYFGTVANRFDLRMAGLPLDELERPKAERLGLFGLGFLQVCSDEGRCRTFHPWSSLIGGGQLDFDLGDERGVSVLVTDAETHLPVAGAVVGYRPSPPALRFRDGRVSFEDAPDASVGGTYTDSKGRASLGGLPEGDVWLGVNADGYRTAAREVRVPPETTVRQIFALQPERNRSGTRLVLPDGSALASAAVLVFDAEGRWKAACSTFADSAGRVTLPTPCREHHRVVLLHPRAAIAVLDVEAITRTTEIEVSPTPAWSPKLRLVTRQGTPVAGVPIVLAFGDIRVGPQAFVFAARRFASLRMPRSGPDGEAVLRGVDIESFDVPVAWPLTDPDASLDLGRIHRGETVELVVEPPTP